VLAPADRCFIDAAGVGITSPGSVWRALMLLEEEGRIKRVRTQIGY
jgi:hypothetical protein